MKTDEELKKDVMMELAWDPGVNSREVKVSVSDGVVTLSGDVGSYYNRIMATKAAARVRGVQEVQNEIGVQLPEPFQRDDNEIEQAVKTALKWSSAVPEENIDVSVEDGQVTLRGQVEWNFQKEKAGKIAGDIIGVKRVDNFIDLVVKAPEMDDLKEKINEALRRSMDFDDDRIHVEIEGEKVILTGKVNSVSEKNRAERAAWAAPGVKEVENNLQVGITKPYFQQGASS